MAKTLYDKVWQAHIIDQIGEDSLIYIDRHLIHEVTSPQAFAGLNEKGRKVRRPDRTVGTMDHSISTRSLAIDACGPANALQLQTLAKNCEEHNIQLFPVGHQKQGIVHVMGPELGLIQPGMTVVCGDSHTATHGAFGALAFGIGTSQVEHVLATQTLKQSRAKSMLINVNGKLPVGITAKDIILAIIGKIGHAGATGHVIEYAGEAIRGLSMEERMTVCNMAIEAGGKNGIIEADDVTLDYVRQRTDAPYKIYRSDNDAQYFFKKTYNASEMEPIVAKPHSPDNKAKVSECLDVKLDRAYIGSCTGGKITDFRAAARLLKGKKVKIDTFIVPATREVEQDLYKEKIGGETLMDIFKNAGAYLGDPSCAACLGGPKDTFGRAKDNQVVISTTNRNFPGRMGSKQAYVYLASPYTAAASALTGHITNPAEFINN